MTKIVVIHPIDSTYKGPEVIFEDEESQLVHLRQGDIDGACGPYCLFMALIICGVADRDNILGYDPVHGNSSLARAFKQMEEYSTFFRRGTHLSDLVKLLGKTYKSKIKTDICCERGVALRPFVEAHILDNHPVILGLDWGGDAGHWVLVIGLEYEVDLEGNESLCRFLVLDPSEPTSNVCAWNGVIQATGSGGIYPFTWWKKDDIKVQFFSALAITQS